MLVDKIKIVELNITELCNRKCWFCPRSDSTVYANQNKHMSVETYHDIERSLKESEYTGKICISGFSEPLMCKTFFEGLDILSPNYEIILITNNDLLTIDKLKKIDNYNISEFRIDLYDGEHQYDKLVKMLEDSEYKSNNLIIKKVYSQAQLDFYNRGGTSKFESSVGIDANRPCHIPFYKAMIDWNGNYLLCHSDWHRVSDISKSQLNVRDVTLVQYLNSDVYKAFTKKMNTTKRNDLHPCKSCDIYGIKEGEIWNHDTA